MTEIADGRLLERFREWLHETRAEAEELAASGSARRPEGAASAEVGLYRLVEEFTALRHEVKLQTRSARVVEEETEKLLAALRQALEALRSIEPKEAHAVFAAGKGLALALAELDEALDRGRQSLAKFGDRLVEEPDEALLAGLDRIYAGRSWLGRLAARGYHQQARGLAERCSLRPQRRALFEALLDGYGLIQQRLARALASEGIARIRAVGEVVDPEQMVVLEIVDGEGPSGIAVEEVRRGYTWNGRLLRCAEVRATKTDSL